MDLMDLLKHTPVLDGSLQREIMITQMGLDQEQSDNHLRLELDRTGKPPEEKPELFRNWLIPIYFPVISWVLIILHQLTITEYNWGLKPNELEIEPTISFFTWTS
jgi:hypothetical protein